MLWELQGKLRPIRLRQRQDRAVRWGTGGLITGALLGSVWYLACWLGVEADPRMAWGVLALSGASAALVGIAWPTSWQSSARLVDGAYGLKDRTVTALEFAARRESDPVRALQMEDAMRHLASVDAQRVVPWSAPRLAPWVIAALGVMITLGLLPLAPSAIEANSSAGPLEVVLDQAALLEETLIKDLDQLAEDADNAELKELAEAMKQAVQELKDPDTDQREALAKLSEMQAALTTAVKQLDIQQLDAQLQDLSEALQVAEATQAASQSLRESNYEKAANELEKIDASSMTKKERDAVTSNLAKLNSKLGEGKKGKLSEAVQEMLDGMANESDAKAKDGMCKAAGVCRSQAMKKKIGECLNCQLNRLSACKGSCQGNCANPGSKVAKTDKPSNKAGTGASNQPTGDEKTKLDSNRRNEDLTGVAGDGPSERETLSTTEARQDSARAYRDRYTEFRKQMEEVLDSEPLPLGHRETVRKYFEAIRPNAEESDTVDKP